MMRELVNDIDNGLNELRLVISCLQGYFEMLFAQLEATTRTQDKARFHFINIHNL
jgi:hypothetical protein